jgi:hypothetical protein
LLNEGKALPRAFAPACAPVIGILRLAFAENHHTPDLKNPKVISAGRELYMGSTARTVTG